MDISNRDISRQFKVFAELLVIHGRDERLADLLSGAAYRIQRMDDPLADATDNDLSSQFRPPVVKLLKEVISTGASAELEELVQLTPAGLFDMMRIKGLGGKKLHTLWTVGRIDSVENLLAACKDGKLDAIPGFGAKTQQNIMAAIDNLNSTTSLFHYADLADAAEKLVEQLKKLLHTDYISLCGDIRRQTTTVAGIDILCLRFPTTFQMSSLRRMLTIATTDGKITTGHTLDELPVTIHHVPKNQFAVSLFEQTGVSSHVAKVNKRLKVQTHFKSEQDIYKAAGFPYIVPELREDVAEWEYAKKPRPLIETKDIKGVVHNHTTWSDGVDSLEDFAHACKKKQFEYVVISDHSKNAHYAGGLKEEKLLRQWEAIDRLNKNLSPFRVFKSIECDILVSGELDYPPSLLKHFDLIIISIHQQLKMAEEKATARLIKAIENPATTILGHMTGRQLLIRPGYPLDFRKVIDACAVNGVIIEINANPYRLDMDWSHIPYAAKKKVMISINPDAHSIQEIDNIRWGVAAARKGGLLRENTWNAMNLASVTKWLTTHRKL